MPRDHAPQVAFFNIMWMLAVLSCGCASPSPVATPDSTPDASQSLALPVGAMAPGVALMGQYDFRLDPATGTVDLLPVHAAQLGIGDNLTVDLTEALSGDLLKCSDCLRVSAITRAPDDDRELVTLTFEVRHPFPAPFQIENRADLHVTNVRLALAIDGDETFFGDAEEHPAVSTRPELWDTLDLLEAPNAVPTSETESLLGTVLFKTTDPSTPEGNYHSVYGWGSHNDHPEGFHVLAMGATETTDMGFRLVPGSTVPITGRLYLLSNFVLNTENHLTRATASYFMPEGAMLEPWHVEITPEESLTDFEDTVIEVAVMDWQAGYMVDPIYPNPDNFRGLKAPSDVAEVWLDIPGFHVPAYGPVTTPARGTGTMLDPYIYEFTVRTPLGIPGGEYPVCAKVIDQRQTSQGVDATLNAATGLRPLAPLVSYQTSILTVCDSPPRVQLAGGFPLGALQPAFGEDEAMTLINGRPAVVYNGASNHHLIFALATVAVPSDASQWVQFDVASSGGGNELDITIVENRLWILFSSNTGLSLARALTLEPSTAADFTIHRIDGYSGPPAYPRIGNQDGHVAVSYRWNNGGLFARPLTMTPSADTDWLFHQTINPVLIPRDMQLVFAGGRWTMVFVEQSQGRARLRLQQANVDPPSAGEHWDRNFLGDPDVPIGNFALTAYKGHWVCMYQDTRDADLKLVTHPSLYPTDPTGWSTPVALTSGTTQTYGAQLELVEGLPPDGLLLLYHGSPTLEPEAASLYYTTFRNGLPFEHCDMRSGVLDTRADSGISIAAMPSVFGTWGLVQRVAVVDQEFLEASFQAY